MSYRFMRILVMFDLPTVTSADRREYALFRKYLIKSGFMMMESIYCKLSPNSTLADAAIENVRKNKPSKGLVQILRVTEKQFAKMDYIVGEGNTEVLSSDDRLVIL